MPKAPDLRQKVLKASLALIEEGGLDPLSMREAARKAGVSHQAPYHHFADREAILAPIAGKVSSSSDRRSCAQPPTRAPIPAKAMGRAYVDFAMRHPAYFQVMFRADAVPLDRYPEPRKLEDEAFGRLVEGIDKAFTDQPIEVRRKIAVTAWALVHGLATLILEGSLARKVGIPKTRQKQLADEVIGTFLSLLERRGS
ncbi:MAG: TetR/AcrR family transcriptional regulator [Methyloceanibacter sp.]